MHLYTSMRNKINDNKQHGPGTCNMWFKIGHVDAAVFAIFSNEEEFYTMSFYKSHHYAC